MEINEEDKETNKKQGLENRIEPIDVKDISMRSDYIIDRTYRFIYNLSESLYMMFK